MALGPVSIEHTNLDEVYNRIEILRSNFESRLNSMELRFMTDVKGNPFTVTFENLDGLKVEGVWNESMARIEF